MKRTALAFALCLLLSNPAWSNDRDVKECDAMAASSKDPLRRAPGVDKIDMSQIEESFTACVNAAENYPDAVTYYQLGRLFHSSAEESNDPTSYSNAVKYYYLAFKLGHGRAAYNLGVLAFWKKLTVKEEPSWTWLNLSINAHFKSAQLGNLDAAEELAFIGDLLYYGRRGFRQDRSLGLRLLQAAAKFGDRTASLILGDIMRSGIESLFGSGESTSSSSNGWSIERRKSGESPSQLMKPLD